MTYTWSGSMGVGLVTSTTGMAVALRSSAARLLSWSGARCTTTTNAIEVWAGRDSKKASSALRPPADAPMPTIGYWVWLRGMWPRRFGMVARS